MKLLQNYLSFKVFKTGLKKSKLYYFLGVILLILVLYFSFSGKDNSSLPTYTAKKNDFKISITESGEIKAASNFYSCGTQNLGKAKNC